MAGVSKVFHHNKEILYIDYTGCTLVSQMIPILREAQRIIIADNKVYLQLTNFTSAFVSAEFMDEAKKVVRETPKLARKRAIVGIHSQGRRILLQAYNLALGNNGMKPFDTLEEAMDWLVKD